MIQSLNVQYDIFARIQKGEKLSYFEDSDSWNHLRGLMWRNLSLMVWNYFMRSSLLVLEKVSVRKIAHSTGCLIHKVQFSLSLAKAFSSLSCTGVFTITSSSSESSSCASSPWWCYWLVELSAGASVAHVEGNSFWAIFLRTSKTFLPN